MTTIKSTFQVGAWSHPCTRSGGFHNAQHTNTVLGVFSTTLGQWGTKTCLDCGATVKVKAHARQKRRTP